MKLPADLIIGLKKRNALAQKQCFELLAPVLLTTARRYTPASLEPMDIIQESFIKIFEKIHQFDPSKGSLDVWANRIVINTAISYLRKKVQIIELDQIDHSALFEDSVALSKLSEEEILQAIESLPDNHKQVFSMYEIEGYTHKEISEMLGIKEVSSRSMLYRAKQKLESILQDYKKDKKWIVI